MYMMWSIMMYMMWSAKPRREERTSARKMKACFYDVYDVFCDVYNVFMICFMMLWYVLWCLWCVLWCFMMCLYKGCNDVGIDCKKRIRRADIGFMWYSLSSGMWYMMCFMILWCFLWYYDVFYDDTFCFYDVINVYDVILFFQTLKGVIKEVRDPSSAYDIPDTPSSVTSVQKFDSFMELSNLVIPGASEYQTRRRSSTPSISPPEQASPLYNRSRRHSSTCKGGRSLRVFTREKRCEMSTFLAGKTFLRCQHFWRENFCEMSTFDIFNIYIYQGFDAGQTTIIQIAPFCTLALHSSSSRRLTQPQITPCLPTRYYALKIWCRIWAL